MDLKVKPRATIELTHEEIKLIGMALLGTMTINELPLARELNAKLTALYARELDNYAARANRAAENAYHLMMDAQEKEQKNA